MRAYTVATTAFALELPGKWVDNILSHFSIAGVKQSRQGVSRKLAPSAILILAIAARLIRDLRLPTQVALDLASRLVEQGGAEARLVTAGGVALGMDVNAVARDVDAKLAQAVEVIPRPTRGRPPVRHKR
ncbi:MAG: hypothetical protein WKF55_11380 [Gemmatimonadaceae bacterium]